jgi:hypothetical protein
MDYTQEELKNEARYDPETGEFWWIKQGPTKRRNMSKPFGTLTKSGYVVVRTRRENIALHRLAVLYMTGEMPERWVDHINGNRADNRWCNLRESTPWENRQNLKETKQLGTSNPKNSYRWYARIRVRGVIHKLGSFDTQEEAHQAYLEAKKRLHTFQPTPRENPDSVS